MARTTSRKFLEPLALLLTSVGAYLLVLLGVVPFGQEAGVILTAIAAVATIGAISIRAKIPAITAGMATIGFGLGTASPIGVISINNLVVTVASILTILGGLGFLISTVGLVVKRVRDASSA